MTLKNLQKSLAQAKQSWCCYNVWTRNHTAFVVITIQWRHMSVMEYLVIGDNLFNNKASDKENITLHITNPLWDESIDG